MSMSKHHNLKLCIAFGTSGDLPNEYQVIDFRQEEGYEAPDPSDVTFQLSLDIGIDGTGKTDIFKCLITTDRNRKTIPKKTKSIIFEEYSYRGLREKILGLVESCEAETWYDCLYCLRRHFLWEYEGMYKEEDLRKMN